MSNILERERERATTSSARQLVRSRDGLSNVSQPGSSNITHPFKFD